MTPRKYIGLVAGLLVLCAISVMPAAAQMKTTPSGEIVSSVTLHITDQGITGIPDTASGGLYLVTIVNDTNRARGLVIQGVDLCCSPYTRFTRVLQPGRETTFRWYFPDNRVVQMRDLLQCKPAARSCAAPRAGRHSTTVVFA